MCLAFSGQRRSKLHVRRPARNHRACPNAVPHAARSGSGAHLVLHATAGSSVASCLALWKSRKGRPCTACLSLWGLLMTCQGSPVECCLQSMPAVIIFG